MGIDIGEDTRTVQREFDAISTPTQVFIAVLVALGVIIGYLLGLTIAVEQLEGQDCIEWDERVWCLEEGEAAGTD